MGIIRVLLALAVVIEHGGGLFGIPLTRMTGGKESVQLFFVISGFYMALILNEKYGASLKSFYTGRFLRLFPLYFFWLSVILAFGVAKWVVLGRSSEAFLLYSENSSFLGTGAWLFVVFSNIFMFGTELSHQLFVSPADGSLLWVSADASDISLSKFLLNPPAWSLGVECAFYLMAPFIVRNLRQSLLWLILALGFRMVYFFLASSLVGNLSERLLPFELPYFMLGVLGYHFYCGQSLPLKTNKPFAVALLVIVVSVILGFQLLPQDITLFGISLWSLPFSLSVPYLFRLTKTWQIDRSIGELSYPIYLVHFVIIEWVQAIKISWISQERCLWVVVITLAISWVIQEVLGKPINVWRENRLCDVTGISFRKMVLSSEKVHV